MKRFIFLIIYISISISPCFSQLKLDFGYSVNKHQPNFGDLRLEALLNIQKHFDLGLFCGISDLTNQENNRKIVPYFGLSTNYPIYFSKTERRTYFYPTLKVGSDLSEFLVLVGGGVVLYFTENIAVFGEYNLCGQTDLEYSFNKHTFKLGFIVNINCKN